VGTHTDTSPPLVADKRGALQHNALGGEPSNFSKAKPRRTKLSSLQDQWLAQRQQPPLGSGARPHTRAGMGAGLETALTHLVTLTWRRLSSSASSALACECVLVPLCADESLPIILRSPRAMRIGEFAYPGVSCPGPAIARAWSWDVAGRRYASTTSSAAYNSGPNRDLSISFLCRGGACGVFSGVRFVCGNGKRPCRRRSLPWLAAPWTLVAGLGAECSRPAGCWYWEAGCMPPAGGQWVSSGATPHHFRAMA